MMLCFQLIVIAILNLFFLPSISKIVSILASYYPRQNFDTSWMHVRRQPLLH